MAKKPTPKKTVKKKQVDATEKPVCKIVFTLQLTKSTLRAFEALEDCEDAEAVKDLLLDLVKEKVAEIKKDAKDEDLDGDGDEEGDEDETEE